MTEIAKRRICYAIATCRGNGGNGVDRVVAMYKSPEDPVVFDKYYFETHVPIAKRIPGLRSLAYGRYVIFYRAIEDGAEIARVLHGARDLRRIMRDGQPP